MSQVTPIKLPFTAGHSSTPLNPSAKHRCVRNSSQIHEEWVNKIEYLSLICPLALNQSTNSAVSPQFLCSDF